MKVNPTPISDLLVLEPKVHGDHRGYFYESFNAATMERHGLPSQFVQDNQSYSSYGTLRGLHFQRGDAAQTKLVRASLGAILDVAVDLRPLSPTYGQHFAVELSADNHKQLLVPKGFAHGFIVLSENAIVQYKCDNFYAPEKEGGLAHDDAALGIDWQIPTKDRVLSERDKCHPSLRDLQKG